VLSRPKGRGIKPQALTRNKNDFAKWIWEVLGDEELAARLHKMYDKDRYVDIIEQRIKELEST